MRIVSGKYKGKRFDVPHTFSARPTTDFAKEGLFNILHNVYVDFDSAPTALDLFCGTGSISLEFLSRGCGRVVSVEKDFKHYQFLRKLNSDLGDLNWLTVHADVFKFLKGHQNTYDIIFADPPYKLENLADIPSYIFGQEHPLLNDDGLFILEHGKNYDFSGNPHFIDHRNYGSVNFSFFK
jgi:16S rRNA (guanine966-N2)-methyltransferase